MTVYKSAEVNLAGIANGDTLVYDSTSGKFLPGVGGSAGAAMPVPSTPTLFTRGVLSGIGWDGLDNAAADMPIGFQYCSIEHQGFSYAAYSDVANGTFDVSASTDISGAPYLPVGWTDLHGSLQDILAAAPDSRIEVNTPATTAFGVYGTSFAGYAIDTGSNHHQVIVRIGNDWQTSNSINMLFGLDSMTSITPECVIFGMQGHTDGTATPSAVVLHSDGSFTAIAAGTPFVVPVNQILKVRYEAGAITVYDSTGTLLCTYSVPVLTGTIFGVITFAGATPIGVVHVQAAISTPGAWTEVGTLPGAGTCMIAASGNIRFKAVNQAGTPGAASAVAVLSYPALPPVPAVANLADVALGSLVVGQVLTRAAGYWTNSPAPRVGGYFPWRAPGSGIDDGGVGAATVSGAGAFVMTNDPAFARMQAFLSPGNAGDSIQVGTVHLDKGNWEVIFSLQVGPDFGIVDFSMQENGGSSLTVDAGTFDCYNAAVGNTNTGLTFVITEAGDYWVNITAATKNGASTAHKIGVNSMVVRSQP